MATARPCRTVPARIHITTVTPPIPTQADVNADGSLTNFQLFAEQGGEGVTVDSHGNVYIAAGQIYVYNSAGKLIDTIGVPERPIQVMFGGDDRKTLFIAARTSLYSMRMKYPGR